MTEFGPLFQEGRLSFEVPTESLPSLATCQLGIQVAADGRIWICMDGTTILRFKPTTPPQKAVPEGYRAFKGPFGEGVVRT